MTPCGSCGQRPAPPPIRVTPTATTTAATPAALAAATDGDFVKVKYLSLNTGQHSVIGMVTKINYGYRSGGDVLLIHKQDLASQPHLFEVVGAPAPAPAPPPPPPAAERVEATPPPPPVEPEAEPDVIAEPKRARRPKTARQSK